MAENPPKSMQPTINFQYYQPPKPQKEKGTDFPSWLMGANSFMPSSYITPMYNPMMGMGFNRPNPYGTPMVVNKNYLIENTGPTAEHHKLATIYEDVLPTKPIIPSSTTIMERLNLYQFVRSSILSNNDGNGINLDGTMRGGNQSLLSYVKFDDLNPYYSYKMVKNVYRGIPEGFLIYRTCYPIREDRGNVICAKDSSAVNIRIYKMTEGSFLINKGKTIEDLKFENFDEWREVAFYEYIRENIIKKKICPNFVTLYGYFISEDCGIDFDAIEVAKFGMKSNEEIEPDFVTSKEAQEKFRKKMNLDPVETCDGKITNNYVDEQFNQLKKILDGDVHMGRFNESGNFNKKNKNVQINKKTIRPTMIKYAGDSGEILEINADAYKGKVLVLLTESGTQNIVNWATRTYQNAGVVKEMVNRGSHTHNEWMNVLFQIMVSLYVMQSNKIFIRNFNIEHNILIKDLQLRGAITNYWKYKVDDLDFYIPNLGHLVFIDSNFKDIDTHSTGSESTFYKKTIKKEENNKLDGQFINKNLSDEEINENAFDMFKNVFNPNNFTNKFDKHFVTPPDTVMKIISEIHKDINSKHNTNIKDYIIDHMTMFLNNRVGTYLKEIETTNVRKEDSRDFKRGQIVVHEEEFGTYKFVLFLEQHGAICKVYTKENFDDDDIITNDIPRSQLFNYLKSEPITQNYKPNESSLSEDDILETYVIK